MEYLNRHAYIFIALMEEIVYTNRAVMGGAVWRSHGRLTANTNFLQLQQELSETEGKIAKARQFYNDVVPILFRSEISLLQEYNNMLKEQDIKQYLNEKNIAFKENASIIGVIFPNKFTYALGSAATALSMQYFAMNFNDSGIVIIGLNNITGRLENDVFLFVPKEEITDVKFNKKLMSYKLEITTSQGTLVFKVNKTMIGTSWHKENLAIILKSL